MKSPSVNFVVCLIFIRHKNTPEAFPWLWGVHPIRSAWLAGFSTSWPENRRPGLMTGCGIAQLWSSIMKSQMWPLVPSDAWLKPYWGFSFWPQARNATQIVEARRAPCRIFWNQEGLAAPDAGEPLRQAVKPATSNAAAEAHAPMVLARWARS